MSTRQQSSPYSNSALFSTRRCFLLQSATLLPLCIGSGTILYSSGSQAAPPPIQDDWGRCTKCDLMFFNGDRKFKGLCPAGGKHKAFEAAGNVQRYQITYDDSTGPGQGDWRFCEKCWVLFFNGYSSKGVCAADGKGHSAAGYNFFLYHDRQRTYKEESGWRFCDKCQALFFARAPETSVCPADQAKHTANAASYKFVVGRNTPPIDE